MEEGEFTDLLKRNAINPKYNEAMECISSINDKLSKIEDHLDTLISQNVSPQTEQEIIKDLTVLQQLKGVFDNVERSGTG